MFYLVKKIRIKNIYLCNSQNLKAFSNFVGLFCFSYWKGTGPYAPSPPCSLPAFGLWKSLSQRISLIREVRNADTKENSQRTLNNSDVVIKHSQGHLVPSQGL